MEGLSQQIKDTKTELQYSTYLDTFFDFFNEYYEGISYYDKLVTTMLADGATEEYQKNIYDQFYQLKDVEYSGSLHSAVDKLGRYLQGKYIYSGPGSVIDILTRYYILGYKDSGMSEADARKKAAEDTQNIISYLYYAYVMGAYYEQAIALYQTGVIDENGGVYTTDFGTKLTQGQIDTTVTALWSSVELTAGCILADMRRNYHDDAPISLVYQTGEGTLLTRTVDYGGFAAERGSNFWLEDPAEELKTYFAGEFCDAFTGIAKLSIDSGSTLTIYDDYYVHINTFEDLDDGSSGKIITPINPTTSDTYTEKLHVTFGGQTIHTYTITVHKKPGDGVFAAGVGTEDFPYVVKTTEQFKSIGDYSDAHFVLDADLDFKGETIAPIKKFSGTLDGNGYTISNCWVVANSNTTGSQEAIYAGLFGELTGTVRNLQVENVIISADNYLNDGSNTAPNKLYAGTIAGYINGGALLYCSVSGSTVGATHNGTYGVCHAGGVAGSTMNATLTNVVCRDTVVTATSTHQGRQSNGNEIGYQSPGWAFAGGLVGMSNNTEVIRCGYTQSESYEKTISAIGGVGACAGGLIGFTNTEVTVAWVTLANAPTVSSNFTKVNQNCLRYGSIVGCATKSLHTVYKYWSSYPSDKKIVQTDQSQDNRWQLAWSTKNVETVNEAAMRNLVSTYADKGASLEKYLTFDGFEALSDGSGLMPLFRFGSTNVVFNYSLIDFPVRKTYVEGDYIDLTGLYSYQCVGLEKLSDITYPYVRVSLGAELLNAPLTAGTYTIQLTASSTCPVTFTITVLPASHIYLEAVTVESTCTTDGKAIQTCLHCGLQKEPEVLEKLGHDIVTIDQGYAATCTTDGKSPSSMCTRCGEKYGGEIITASGKHRAVPVEGYPATCQATGLTDGEICGDCETVLKEQSVIPIADHKTETVTILEPTCVSGGVKQEKCTVCGEIVKLENLKALGHDYQSAVTEPTCEDPGYTTHTCSRCGDSYTDSFTSPTDHHYGDGVVTREPTCTELGEMTYTCTCGKTHTEPIPTIAHNYAEAVTDPTCTEMGYTTHSCTKCGDSYVDTYTSPRGHSWDEGKTVTAPTLIATGRLRQTCTVCDTQQDTVIPSLTSCDGGIDCASRKFTDVAGIHDWSHVGIDYAIRCSLFYGTSDTTFSPNAPMTRAMLVAVLYRMEGRPSVEGQSHRFQDVPDQAWYEDALIWASSNGVVSGISETEFDPESNVTRQQVAAILYRYANLHSYDTSASTELSAYPDHKAVAPYAKSAMSWANATGLIQVSVEDGETLLSPNNSATRAQLAAILMRFMKNVK